MNTSALPALPIESNHQTIARLFFQNNRLSRFTSSQANVIHVEDAFVSEGIKTATFIQAIYKQQFSADIQVTYPFLMSALGVGDKRIDDPEMRNKKGDDKKILAALGFRPAKEQTLFLEQYLNLPIEEKVSQAVKQTIARDEIVEVGNLASAGGGASLYLFVALASFLYQSGYRYVVVTSTHFLFHYFKKLGLRPKKIGEASAHVLTDDQHNKWGTYYEKTPQVIMGSLEESLKILQSKMGVLYENEAADCLRVKL